jgi:DNA-binding PadR family transcriptional regulator
MSVKHALLALLSRGPASAYQLRREFDESTNSSWPLNIGQVSTTLQRLSRDGLIERAPAPTDSQAEPWQLTDAGYSELALWWKTPVLREQRGRDELVIKLAVAAVVPGVDVPALVQCQRHALQQLLHDIVSTRRHIAPSDLAAHLVLDYQIFATEAELRWLDSLEGDIVSAHHAQKKEQDASDASALSEKHAALEAASGKDKDLA